MKSLRKYSELSLSCHRLGTEGRLRDMVMTEKKRALLAAVDAASNRWKAAFNAGDAAGCARQYEETAVMHARPFGTFNGAVEIQEFWQKLIDDGFTDVEYVDPEVEVLDESTALLTSGWRMNKAGGVIHKELWVLHADGVAKLREDDFEAKQ